MDARGRSRRVSRSRSFQRSLNSRSRDGGGARRRGYSYGSPRRRRSPSVRWSRSRSRSARRRSPASDERGRRSPPRRRAASVDRGHPASGDDRDATRKRSKWDDSGSAQKDESSLAGGADAPDWVKDLVVLPPDGVKIQGGALGEDGRPLPIGVPPPASQVRAPAYGRFKQLRIPAAQRGALIGRGGEAINAIRKQSQSEVKLKHDAGDQYAYIMITGNIELAETLIMNRLSSAVADPDAPGELVLNDIPQELVGQIIGTGGQHLKDIGRETQCRLDFQNASELDPSQPNMKVCRIRGPPANIPKAEELLRAKVKEVERLEQLKRQGKLRNVKYPPAGGVGVEECQSYSTSADGMSVSMTNGADSGETLIQDIPQEYVGQIIGTGGCHLKDITKETGCRLDFRKLDEFDPSAEPLKVCRITGPKDKIQFAEELLRSKISEVTRMEQRKQQTRIPGAGGMGGTGMDYGTVGGMNVGCMDQSSVGGKGNNMTGGCTGWGGGCTGAGLNNSYMGPDGGSSICNGMSAGSVIDAGSINSTGHFLSNRMNTGALRSDGDGVDSNINIGSTSSFDGGSISCDMQFSTMSSIGTGCMGVDTNTGDVNCSASSSVASTFMVSGGSAGSTASPNRGTVVSGIQHDTVRSFGDGCEGGDMRPDDTKNPVGSFSSSCMPANQVRSMDAGLMHSPGFESQLMHGRAPLSGAGGMDVTSAGLGASGVHELSNGFVGKGNVGFNMNASDGCLDTGSGGVVSGNMWIGGSMGHGAVVTGKSAIDVSANIGNSNSNCMDACSTLNVMGGSALGTGSGVGGGGLIGNGVSLLPDLRIHATNGGWTGAGKGPADVSIPRVVLPPVVVLPPPVVAAGKGKPGRTGVRAYLPRYD